MTATRTDTTHTDTTLTAASWDTHAVAKPGPMMVVHPERAITDEQLAEVATGSGLNGPFVADLLASCATHERTGVSLFRSLEARTDNPMAKSKFNTFGDHALEAVRIYDQLLETVGVPVHYASPPARLTEAIDTRMMSAFLLTGAADQLTIELKGVEAVLLASTMCLANSGLLRSLAEGLDEGDPTREALLSAVERLEPVQWEHLEWALDMQRQMVSTQASSALAQKAGQAAESMVGKLRDAMGRTARNGSAATAPWQPCTQQCSEQLR